MTDATPRPTAHGPVRLGQARLAALLLVAALAASGDARAQTLCSEPVAPICATEIPATDPSAATDQGVARARCIDDAGAYREKLAEYRRCLEGSLDQAERKLTAVDAFIECLRREEEHCVLEERE